MSFCQNCGYKHDDDAKFCVNCGSPVKRIQPQNSQYFTPPNQQYYFTPQYQQLQQGYPQPVQREEVRGVYGLGKAIAGVILSFFALIFALSAFSLILPPSYSKPLLVFIFLILATPFSILSIVFGAQSIRNFKYAKNNLDRVPVPTLILGIHSLVVGIASAIFPLSYFGLLFFLFLILI